MAQYIEDVLPPIRAAGLNTLYPASFGSSVTFAQTPTYTNGKGTPVLGSAGNNALLATQSGDTFLFDSATGISFTLPTAVKGLQFDFIVQTAVTSGSHKVLTNAATQFLLGAVVIGTTSGSSASIVQGDGSTKTAFGMNGTTTGGLGGTKLQFVALSATQWEVSGTDLASGAISTPFVLG